MQAILLCGGMGTRLRSVVADRPKPMADICGKPFLQYLLEMLRDKGITEVIFALGYMGEMIEEYFQDGSAFGLKIAYSYEEEPLGTGGAIRNALPKILEEDVLVLNADTYFPMDYQGLYHFHQENDGDFSLATRAVPDISRYGAVRRDSAGRILAWNEKLGDGGQQPGEGSKQPIEGNAQQAASASPKSLSGEINGGIYVMKKSLIAEIPEGKQSLEQDCIPKWLSEGKRIFGLPFHGYFMDIGIPEDYRQFILDVEQGKHGR
ncbi:D-glycero-alpha-D-manno-heptose 1-phosphate guanylyltransferase [Oribacterium sinus]|uniref:D-glycero-alpha-D-manno-heptose 1-phosphate guanylyltransferase n=1 Tax=Oribacterium sinus TaxID=237576 RepID=A0A7W9SF79_9FIRM|nr:nucleotidyltransferase family protein [Oribacterium sinus]MBB6041068.1 D-glycero-alpha-D-manno-heptose 1-phosphate guanylyltransferase [Oribacterium sinus]